MDKKVRKKSGRRIGADGHWKMSESNIWISHCKPENQLSIVEWLFLFINFRKRRILIMAIDTKVTEDEVRKQYAEVVRGNILSILHRPGNRVVLQVVIYPQGDMAITHRFYMDIAKRLLKYRKEVYVDLYPQNGR